SQGGLLSPELQRRVEQLQKDVRMLAELERIRLDQTAVRDGHFDNAGSALEYATAFREYGIDAEALTTADVAEMVRNSAIRKHLVAGLDDWALALPRSSHEAQEVLAVARQADPDKWRNRLRDMVETKKPGDLEQLAGSAPVEQLPVATLALLGRSLF